MKSSGLSNRFNKDELESAWAFWFRCLWCGKAGFNCFHHIKSPCSSDYKKGRFNQSILNALPLHNEGCHLYNPQLHKKENESMLLKKVLSILKKNEYKLKKIDFEFKKIYASNYY